MPEYVLVFFVSSDKINWTPLERDDIPTWLKDETLIERMMAGECVRNIEQEERQGMKWYSCSSVDRINVKPSVIMLPPRMFPMGLAKP